MPANKPHPWTRARLRALLTSAPTPMGTAQRLGVSALGVLWLLDGLLQAQPYFLHHFVAGVIAPNASGQPGIVGDPITWLVNILMPIQAPFSVFAAVVEIALGVALLARRAVRPVLLVSFAWALGIWFTGEGLGGIFSSTPNAFAGVIGTSPLYIVAGLLVWPRAGHAPAPGGPLGQRGARALWALLWLGGAALWLSPANDGPGAFRDLLAAAPSGTGWLSSLHTAMANLVAGDGREVGVALAIVSAAIAVSVLSRRAERVGLIASIPLLVTAWVLVEGFGAVFTGMATDVGTSPLMILIAVQLLAQRVEFEAVAGRANATKGGALLVSGARGADASLTRT